MVSRASRPFSTWNHSSSSETVTSGILPRDDHWRRRGGKGAACGQPMYLSNASFRFNP
jgi:hypothetical protein